MPEIGFDLLKTEQTCHPTYAFGLRQSFVVVDAKENSYIPSIYLLEEHSRHISVCNVFLRKKLELCIKKIRIGNY